MYKLNSVLTMMGVCVWGGGGGIEKREMDRERKFREGMTVVRLYR